MTGRIYMADDGDVEDLRLGFEGIAGQMLEEGGLV